MTKHFKVDCSECDETLKDDDAVFVCHHCEAALCESCKEDHDCITDDSNTVEPDCPECGNEGELLECAECSERMCQDCLVEHVKDKHNDFEETTAEEYSTKNAVDKL